MQEAPRRVRIEWRELDTHPAGASDAPEIGISPRHEHRDAGERVRERRDELRRRDRVDVVDVDERPLLPQDLEDGGLVGPRRVDGRLLAEHRHRRRHRPGMLWIDHDVQVGAEPRAVLRVELVGEVRLADTCHALHRDDRDAASAPALQRGIDLRQLGLAADEDLVLLGCARPSCVRAVVELPAVLTVAQSQAPGRGLLEYAGGSVARSRRSDAHTAGWIVRSMSWFPGTTNSRSSETSSVAHVSRRNASAFG